MGYELYYAAFLPVRLDGKWETNAEEGRGEVPCNKLKVYGHYNIEFCADCNFEKKS